MLNSLYVFFFGLLLAAFVGLGIAAFYPSPTIEVPKAGALISPGEARSPLELQDGLAEGEKSTQEAAQRHSVQSQEYSRHVSIIAIVCAIAILAVGMLLPGKWKVVADGTILGGVFTLAYGIFCGLGSGDAMFRFATVAVGLPIVLALGYLRFVRSS